MVGTATALQAIPAGLEIRRSAPKHLRVGLFGCPLDTGNRGVDALCMSALEGLASTDATFEVLLFDSGMGDRSLSGGPSDSRVRVTQVGCFHSRRYHRFDNLMQMYAAASLGACAAQPMLRRLKALDAILDVSGGDSFSDIYGTWRFNAVTLPKLIALRLNVPLILLPQTYGPYKAERASRIARYILNGAAQVWARDAGSLDVVRTILGSNFDRNQHRCGVDVAFGLRGVAPKDDSLREALLRFTDGAEVVIGLNISGLLYNRPGEDIAQFGIRNCYHQTIDELLRKLLDVDGARILLIPHVATDKSADCDATAIRAVRTAIEANRRTRLFPVPARLDPSEIKWIVSQCDWLCGTRMHACIAALSRGIPTVGMAYSDKMRGVFEGIGVGDWVLDLRQQSSDQIIAKAMETLQLRSRSSQVLWEHLQGVRQKWRDQFAAIVERM